MWENEWTRDTRNEGKMWACLSVQVLVVLVALVVVDIVVVLVSMIALEVVALVVERPVIVEWQSG